MTLMTALVFAVVVCGLVFFAAWLALPNLRVWIERPKYRFQSNVESYDQALWPRSGTDRERRK